MAGTDSGTRMKLPVRMTPRQEALLEVIQGLDPAIRHTLTITCRGNEPWKVERILEHRDIELRVERNNN